MAAISDSMDAAACPMDAPREGAAEDAAAALQAAAREGRSEAVLALLSKLGVQALVQRDPLDVSSAAAAHTKDVAGKDARPDCETQMQPETLSHSLLEAVRGEHAECARPLLRACLHAYGGMEGCTKAGFLQGCQWPHLCAMNWVDMMLEVAGALERAPLPDPSAGARAVMVAACLAALNSSHLPADALQLLLSRTGVTKLDMFPQERGSASTWDIDYEVCMRWKHAMQTWSPEACSQRKRVVDLVTAQLRGWYSEAMAHFQNMQNTLVTSAVLEQVDREQRAIEAALKEQLVKCSDPVLRTE